jgi:hypothetical protein
MFNSHSDLRLFRGSNSSGARENLTASRSACQALFKEIFFDPLRSELDFTSSRSLYNIRRFSVKVPPADQLFRGWKANIAQGQGEIIRAQFLERKG